MRVIISAGGTGGHIYPALSIIEKIKEYEPKSEFLFIGTTDRMESEIIPKYNIPYFGIEIKGIIRNFTLKNFKIIYNFIKSIKIVKKKIKEFNPDIVIGVGGYVTAPVIYASKKLGYKTIIHEQNCILGLSNKFLLRFTDLVAVSFEETIGCIKTTKSVYTGNPCSDRAITIKNIPKTNFGLTKSKNFILIVMGSLGASSILELLFTNISLFKNKDYEVLIVTGNKLYNKYNKVNVPNNIYVEPFIDNIAGLMKEADIIVSRAGASTISEIMALEIPSILIPSPYVPNNHQFLNAQTLVKKGSAKLIEEKKFKVELLIDTIDKLLENKELYDKIKKSLINSCPKNSGELIYKCIKNILNK